MYVYADCGRYESRRLLKLYGSLYHQNSRPLASSSQSGTRRLGVEIIKSFNPGSIVNMWIDKAPKSYANLSDEAWRREDIYDDDV